jgi:hypothetical protein
MQQSRLKEHFIESKIPIDEILDESNKKYPHSLYIYDPDRIKIQFLYK